MNADFKFDVYPLSLIHKLLDQLGVANFYSTLDLKQNSKEKVVPAMFQ